MAAESIIVILGDDSPDDVVNEVLDALDTCSVVSFNWDNEDNESMPATAAYLAEKYNTHGCALMYAGSKTREYIKPDLLNNRYSNVNIHYIMDCDRTSKTIAVRSLFLDKYNEDEHVRFYHKSTDSSAAFEKSLCNHNLTLQRFDDAVCANNRNNGPVTLIFDDAVTHIRGQQSLGYALVKLDEVVDDILTNYHFNQNSRVDICIVVCLIEEVFFSRDMALNCKHYFDALKLPVKTCTVIEADASFTFTRTGVAYKSNVSRPLF